MRCAGVSSSSAGKRRELHPAIGGTGVCDRRNWSTEVTRRSSRASWLAWSSMRWSWPQAKDYVRQTQRAPSRSPLWRSLQQRIPWQSGAEERLLALLAKLRSGRRHAQGYGLANLLTLLRQQRGNLRGLDLSHLDHSRGVSARGRDARCDPLSGALLRECVFTEAFDAIIAVAISSTEQYWAAGSQRGEVRVWREGGQTLHLAWQAHTDIVLALAFSPDERTLASGSFDGSVKLWDVERRVLLWSGWHTNVTGCLAFSPDGGLLASGAHDGTVRLWDAEAGHPLAGPAASRSGHLAGLAPGWEPARHWRRRGHNSAVGEAAEQAGSCVQTLSAHSSWVHGLAFAPDGRSLASAS